MATTKGLFTTNRAYTALLRNTWVTTQYNTPVYQTDPYFNYTTILLSGDTFNTLAFNSDASLNNLNVSVLGDTKASRNSPYGTNWSVYTPATGSYVSGSNNIFDISSTTVVWTYESWVMPLTASHFFAIGSGSSYGNSITVGWSVGTANKFRVNGANGAAVLINFESTGTYAAGAWYHVAVTRTSAGVYTLYINGVADGTQTYNAVTLASGTTIVINGVNDNNGLGNTGGSFYLSNMRFLVGTALYTGNFTVPTAPLTAIANTALLTCQSNRFVDNGPYAVALTPAGSISISKYNPVDTGSSYSNYGSGYFDGTGDYLILPYSESYQLGTGNFTIEFWINASASGSYNQVVGTHVDLEAGSWRVGNRFNSANQVYFARGNSWFYKYMDTENYFVLKTGVKVYTFKKEFQNKPDARRNAPNELDGIIKKFNEELDGNKTVGTNGSYKIDKKSGQPSIKNNITLDIFKYKLEEDNIDFAESYRRRKKIEKPTKADIDKFQSELINQGAFNASDTIQKNGNKEIVYNYFIFEGNPKTFIGFTNQMSKELDAIRQQLQNE
jgi:hypothetical protein